MTSQCPQTDLRCTCVLSLVAQHLIGQKFMCISCRAPTQQTSSYDAKARSARRYASVLTFNLIKTFKIIQGKYIYFSIFFFAITLGEHEHEGTFLAVNIHCVGNAAVSSGSMFSETYDMIYVAHLCFYRCIYVFILAR